MPLRLTEPAIQAAIRKAPETGRKDLSDGALPGLRLRVTAAGKAGWVLACRDQDGRMRRFQLGGWPDMGVAAAREAARELRVQIRKGADPTADRKRHRAQAKDAAQGIGTLASLVDHYGRKVGEGVKSWPESKRRIELVFAGHLQRPLASVTRMDLQMAIDGYDAAQQARGAGHALRPVLKWAVPRGFVERDRTELHMPAKAKRRERVLTADELASLLATLRASRLPYAAAMQFMLLTVSRREEVVGAFWRDVDFRTGIWRIEAERSKNKIEHRVPLPRQALELLQSLGPVSPDGLIFHSSKGGRLTNWDRATKLVMAKSGTSSWTRHDLRRTGATMLGEMGELPHVIEAALNHTVIQSQVATIYNQSRYRPQVAAALQRLADALDGIEQGGAEVVPLRTSGALP